MKSIVCLAIVISCCFVFVDCSSLEKNKQDSRFSASLNWGKDPLTQKPWTKKALQKNNLVETELKKLLNSAQEDLKDESKIFAVDRIEKEGILASDPRHSASDKALGGTESILKWAICASAGETSISQRCLNAAYSGVMKWVERFEPTGNPINDNNLLRLLLSIDLILDKLDAQDRENINKWVKTFITMGDQFFENLHDGFRVNNWMTWRLAIRSLAGIILQDNKIIIETKKLVSEHAKVNLNPPLNWTPAQKCANSKNENRYGGHDFRRRDALHYHVYNLEAWTWIALFTPEIMDKQTVDSVNMAFDFLRPYYLGEKVHVEFVCSEIKFDEMRKEAGQREYENKNWDPNRARKLLRMARSTQLITIREWSKNVVDENYQPWIKFLSVIQNQSE